MANPIFYIHFFEKYLYLDNNFTAWDTTDQTHVGRNQWNIYAFGPDQRAQYFADDMFKCIF